MKTVKYECTSGYFYGEENEYELFEEVEAGLGIVCAIVPAEED